MIEATKNTAASSEVKKNMNVATEFGNGININKNLVTLSIEIISIGREIIAQKGDLGEPQLLPRRKAQAIGTLIIGVMGVSLFAALVGFAGVSLAYNEMKQKKIAKKISYMNQKNEEIDKQTEQKVSENISETIGTVKGQIEIIVNHLTTLHSQANRESYASLLTLGGATVMYFGEKNRSNFLATAGGIAVLVGCAASSILYGIKRYITFPDVEESFEAIKATKT